MFEVSKHPSLESVKVMRGCLVQSRKTTSVLAAALLFCGLLGPGTAPPATGGGPACRPAELFATDNTTDGFELPAVATIALTGTVVTGSNNVTVYAGDKPFEATVVSYDPSVDVAILAVPHLPPPPLVFAAEPAKTGADVVVLGYPGGGNFTATPARIREAIRLSGPDIYGDPEPVTRDVYTIRADVEQGDSGGPLIDLNGQVLGVVFGAAIDDAETGFVLTAGEVAGQLAKIGATQPVGTGACVS